MEDHYQTLEVEREADATSIKKAYRKLAHKYHPDKEGGDEEKFKQVNSAYQVLSDDQKRAQYDQFGQTFEGAPSGAGGPFNPFGQQGYVNVDDLGDIPGVGEIFEQFFGGTKRQSAKQGDDVAVDVQISFIQSAQGLTQDISHRIYQTCERCKGNQAEPGTPIKECATCSGQGVVTRARQTMLGTINQRSTCPTCKGEGKQVETTCTQCRGEGRELKERTLSVDIPAGIADGQSIRLSGKGEAAPASGQTGDLYVTVHVSAHDTLKRQGDTVQATSSISFVDAVLGSKIEVDTLDGPEQINIPAGTQPFAEITLAGKGFPHLGSTVRGDQIVTITVEIPTKISKQQRAALNQYKSAKTKQGLFS